MPDEPPRDPHAPAGLEEEHFRATLEHAPIGMALVGVDGRFLLVNRALCRITGYSEEELLGLTFQEITHPDDLDADLEHVRALLAGETGGYEMEKRYLRPGGGVAWAQLSVALLRRPDGEPLHFISQVQDISARREAEEALRYSEAKFAGIVSAASDGIVSVDEEGRITLFNQGAERIFGWAAAEVLEQPVDVLLPERLRGPGAGGLRLLRALGIPPRRAAERGTVRIVGRRRGGEEFVAEATVTQLSVGGARIFTAVIRDVTERERRERRDRLLAEAGRVLAASLELEDSLRSVARLAVPALADWCVLELRDEEGGPLRAAESAAADERQAGALREALARYPGDASPVPASRAEVADTGVPRLLADLPEEEVRAAARDAEHLALLEALAPRSAMLVPLVAHGRPFGAITFAVSGSGRRYGPEDLAFAEELGRLAALAIDNARLYRVAREARRAAERAADRTARLQRVTAAFSEALTPAQVAEVVVREGMEALDASAGTLAVLDEEAGELEMVHAVGIAESHVQAWRRFPLDSATPLGDAIRGGRPVVLADPEELASRYPGFVARSGSSAHQAWAAVPVVAEGQALGSMALSFAEPRRLTGGEQEFLLAIARQCAGALERARLYDRERRARAQAEAATRARDDLVGVVAHDLRNPLTAISMYASLLLEVPRDTESQRANLATVVELTDQMNRLLQDLLDATRLEAGQLSVHPTPLPVRPLLEEAGGLVRMAAAREGLAVEVEAPHDLPLVLADRDRILQVLSNLLGNAVKFTPRGGRITLRAGSEGGRVVVSVADTGRGIPPEHLPRVFDRFWQGDSRRKGAGLGLAIARGIVEAHGGSIRVESGVGSGSTFFVELPAVN